MIDRRIKFRHIQCFVEICREGSFKLASEKLCLTQPAISKTMKELECLLGHRLLVRDRGGVNVTEDGAVFLRFAQMSIAALQQGLDGIERVANAKSPILSVGVLPSVAARLIPDVAHRFGALMPEAVLRISDGPYAYLIDQLKLGALDLVIGRMGALEQMKGVTFSPLYHESIALVVRAGHPLLNEPALTRIAEWPIVYPVDGAAIRAAADRFFVEQGIGTLPRKIETVSGAFGRVFVQNSDAVWVISEGVVANEVARGVLVRLPISGVNTLGAIGVMTREDWDVPPAGLQFRRALGAAISDTALAQGG